MICLALDAFYVVSVCGTVWKCEIHTKVHNVVTANGAVVHHDIPCPKGNSRPLMSAYQYAYNTCS